VLGASLAVAKAAADEAGASLYRWLGGPEANTLPVPMLNVINGGVHAQNSIDLQEFMLVPVGSGELRRALRIAAEVYHTLKGVISSRGLATGVGDEGGFAPDLPSTEAAIAAILEAAEKAGHADKVAIALEPGRKRGLQGRPLCAHRRRQEPEPERDDRLLASLCKQFPIISIEDGHAEDDWDGWSDITQRLGDKIQLVGDDIFVTNIDRLKLGIERKVANSILIKLNQIGTLTETLDCIELARKNGYSAVISHRSGETEDATIADLAVATGVASSRPARPAARSRRPSTTSCSASRKSSAPRPLPGLGLLPARQALAPTLRSLILTTEGPGNPALLHLRARRASSGRTVASGLELFQAVSSRSKRTKSRRAARAHRRRLSARRLVLLALVVLIALLYAGPLRSFYDKRELVRSEHVRVALLRSQHDALTQKLKSARKAKAIERAARRLFYIKPGERLYIVTGIDAWRHNQARAGR